MAREDDEVLKITMGNRRQERLLCEGGCNKRRRSRQNYFDDGSKRPLKNMVATIHNVVDIFHNGKYRHSSATCTVCKDKFTFKK